MPSTYSATQTYRMNQINGASPLDLLIMAYDVALASCGQHDLDRLTRALGVLRDALDYSYDADVALGFFKLYQYCGDLARKGEFDEAAALLREIRDSWAQIREKYQAPQSAVSAQPYTMPTQSMAAAGSFVMAG